MEENQADQIDVVSTRGLEPSQQGVLSYSKTETDEKFGATNKKVEDVNDQLRLVIIILLVMVATLLIDSFHFNSATYREYSEKLEAVDSTQKINQELLDHNKQNQDLIIQLLKNQAK